MNIHLITLMKLLAFTLAIIFGIAGVSCSNQRRIDRVSNAANDLAGVVNINTANESELEKLPHIGETLARRIVEFREQNGPFRRPENLLLVDGISEKRFQEIRPLIRTE